VSVTTEAPLLEVRGLSKSFPGLKALDDVSISVSSKEIVAVVGQNGSGKSTLVKILAGVHAADPGGTFAARGPAGELLEGDDARGALHFIHQDLGLIPMLSTIENLDLGRAHGHGMLRIARTREEARRARELITEFNADFDVTVPVRELSAAERTIVAIVRALEGWTRPDNVLILDEPTAALHGEEVGRLFDAIRLLAERGAGIIFISHRLDEVMELADRVVALRDGRLVADERAGHFDHHALIRMITGKELTEARIERDVQAGATTMEIRGLRGATVRGLDLDVRAGEMLGVTGLLGSGREHLCSLLFGATKRDGGTVRVDGNALPAGDTGAAIARDVGFVPADRRGKGAVMTMNVRENLTLPRLRPLRRALGHLSGRAERQEAAEWIERVGLRPPRPEQALSLFSGGNQQKVVLAKWLRNKPRVLLLDEPTQGVDVGAKAAIYQLVTDAVSAGAAVLVSSSDTKELCLLCDRVVVLRDGVVAAELDRASLDEATLVGESLGLGDSEVEAIFGDLQEEQR